MGSNQTGGAALVGVHTTAGLNATVSGNLNVETGSVLTGNGEVQGSAVVAGLLAPTGKLVIDGTLALTGGEIEFEIGGLTPISEHDVLEVSGDVDFGGIIRTIKTNNHNPQAGDSYLVMTHASKSGTPTYEGLDFGSQLLSPELSPTSLEFITGFSSGAAVVAITASDSAVDPDGPFLLIQFDEPIDAVTFTAEDVVLTGPGGSAIDVDSIEPFAETNDTFLLRPDPGQFVDGAYTISIGPNVLDFVGNVMNQDADQQNGEPVEDVFVGGFRLGAA